MLSGPSVFSHVIRAAKYISLTKRVSQATQFYDILLILTDGQITDLQETIE